MIRAPAAAERNTRIAVGETFKMLILDTLKNSIPQAEETLGKLRESL